MQSLNNNLNQSEERKKSEVEEDVQGKIDQSSMPGHDVDMKEIVEEELLG